MLSNGQIEPSAGTIRNFIEESAAGATERYFEIKEEIQNSEIINTDETPVRSTERKEKCAHKGSDSAGLSPTAA